ncbi:hypothetical protein PTKIN_Ptkin01aG0375000 [Pterospermum kingtungense]
MEFQGRLKNESSGKFPDFGAIFMSNASTREECFNRNLFGLPMSSADFVKRVKVGMILFLFEYEKRELYGVFKATTDGELNIIPHAYCSSGKKFPAQVRFTTIWHCHPLKEHEFQKAIRDNYFATGKFNFGLSKDQVQRLLWLFDSRKIRRFQSQSFIDSEITKRYHEASSEKREMERYRSNHTIARKKLKSEIASVSLSNPELLSCSGKMTTVKDESQLLGSGDSHIASRESRSMHYNFSYCPEGPCSQSSLPSVAGHSSTSESGPHPDNATKSQPVGIGQEVKELETSGNLDILGDYIPLLLSDDYDSDTRASPEYGCYMTDQIGLPFSASGPYVDTCQPVFAASPITEVGDVHMKGNAYGSKSPLENCQESDNSYDDNQYKSVRGLYSDAPGNRNSVFSRLNFSSRVQHKEDDIREEKSVHSTAEVDKSAQEVMEELQQMHDKWKKIVRMTRSVEGQTEHSVSQKTNVFLRLSRTSVPDDEQDNDIYTRSRDRHDRLRDMKPSVFSRLSRTWEPDARSISPMLQKRHGKQKIGPYMVSSLYSENEEIYKSLSVNDSDRTELDDNLVLTMPVPDVSRPLETQASAPPSK